MSKKFFRDPIHNIIRIDDEETFLLDIINSPGFQRLRRIKQLGFAYYVYPGANHTRFSHSLGAFHLAKRILSHLEKDGEKISKSQKDLIKTAALIHDIGHGPFSHIFEHVLSDLDIKPNDHEEWGWKIIQSDEQIMTILRKKRMVQGLKKVFDKVYTPSWLFSLISSQFDVDRLDYLLRDCMMTGVKYSDIDLEWIIRNLKIVDSPAKKDKDGNPDKIIVFDGKRGLGVMDQYLMGRFYLYKYVVYHKTVRAAERMLQEALKTGLGDTAEEELLINDALKKI